MIKNLAFSLTLLLASMGSVEAAVIKKTDIAQAHEIFIDSGDSKIFCRTMGQGKPLVVIHGGPGLTQDYLLPQLSKLAERNFVIFYDQRGCGRSTGEIHQDTMNITTFVNDLENIRKAFNFDKISLLGHSWGGLLAMHYAIEHPKSVDKLILSNSEPASSDDITIFMNEWTRRMAPHQGEIAAIQNMTGFQEGDPALHERFSRIIFRTYCHVPEHASLLDLRMTHSAAINCTKINALFFETTLGKPFNLHESLKTLRVPTLILHGDNDVIPAITAQNIHNSILDSKYVEIKNCGHFPYIEQPNEYFKLLKDFLN